MNDYDISSIFVEMENYLLNSMSRNMKRHTDWEKDEGFQWDMWQSQQLKSLSNYRRENGKYIKNRSEYIMLKIDELLRQSNEHGMMEEEIKILNAIKKGYKPGRTPKGIESSFFNVNTRKLNAMIESVNDGLNKGSLAMLRMANDEYRKTIYKAQVFANTGTLTVDQSIDMATKDFLSKGINCIEYNNGKRVNIASYAEMAIKTANKRAYLQGEGSKRNEWGVHTVLISRYGACSEICLPWQGKVYVDDVWSGGTSEIALELGFPLLSTAISGHLFHPNCKHTMTTFFPDITTIPSKADVAKTRENSDTIATQRYNERNIRKYKRLENGSLDEQNKAKYGLKVKEWQGKQRELMNAHPEVHRSYKREGLRGVNAVNL
ncbi:MAG: phage minor capsid protein [Carnobacterium sp.]|uniref:phage minor capsid protein n=1 Tax=Carnobacterium sp. TaxID=48221 RepID=UPI002FC708BB